ncbi:MAG: porin [Burkholderiaceae bacterium]|nr:porin [Burkholderiaceae bacterium]
MKKSLLALAALGAFAGTVHAQSSVTVYGILDLGYLATRGTQGGASSAGTALTTAGTTNGGTLNTSSFNQSNLATSRLGFRGVEDLGGGLSANFVAEIGLTPNSNSFSGSTNSRSTPLGTTYAYNATSIDNRQSFVGLSNKGLGTVRIGRQYTPVHEVLCANNAGQCNAIAGDVIYSGANSSDTLSPFNKLDDSYQVRASNAVTVRTENIGGFTAAALYSASLRSNENAGAVAASQGATDRRMWGANLAFTGVKNLNISGAWQQSAMRRDNAVATDAANVAIGGTLYSLTPGVQAAVDLKQSDVFGNISYDFGVVKLALQTVSLKVTTASVETLKKNANQLSVTAPVSKTINAWASYGQGKRTLPTNTTTIVGDKKFTGFQLGSTYDLSKRSSLYAIYGQNYQEKNAAALGSDWKDVQYSVGVKHSF